MAELAKLSKCPRCGMTSKAGPNTGKHYRFCLTNVSCGLRTELCETPELADEAWNSLCEKIRIGRWVGGDVPEHLQIRSVRFVAMGYDRIECMLEPIPAPPSKDGVLRDFREMLDGSGDLIIRAPSKESWRSTIDAVLGAEQ